jgi:hypothetical protein
MKQSEHLAAESSVLGACVYRFKENPVEIRLMTEDMPPALKKRVNNT